MGHVWARAVAATQVALTLLAFATLAAAEDPLIGERQALIFQQTCVHCHVRPGIGVPLLGDGDEWEARRARGFETLLTRTVEGFRGMPPLGTCSFCTEDDLRRLVAFMAGYARVPDGGTAARADSVEGGDAR